MGSEVGAGADAPPDVPAPVAGVPGELAGAEPSEGDAAGPAADVAVVASVLGDEAAELAGVAGLPVPDEPEAVPGDVAWVEGLPPVLRPGDPGPVAEGPPPCPGLVAPVSEPDGGADVPGPPGAEGPGGSAVPGPPGPR
jgi:hypothetical protein